MEDSYQRGFGLLIAYVLPGFVCLAGISAWIPFVATWLVLEPHATASVGSFLHLILASVAVGLTISAVRWAIVDTLHHHTGLPYPHFDFSRLQEKLDAFLLSIEFYYRYYQFYANMFIAVPVFWLSWRNTGRLSGIASDGGFLALEGILLAASRDTLRRYYHRVSLLLGTIERPFAEND